MFFCIFLDTVLFKLRLQFTMALYDLQAEHKKKDGALPPAALGRQEEVLHLFIRVPVPSPCASQGETQTLAARNITAAAVQLWPPTVHASVRR